MSESVRVIVRGGSEKGRGRRWAHYITLS